MPLVRLHYSMVINEKGKYVVYNQGEVVDLPLIVTQSLIDRNKATPVDAPVESDLGQPDDDIPLLTSVKRGRPKKQS